VHQFVRIGTLAIMQGGSAISQDLPPFLVARGGNNLCGLNTIGLRRANFSPAERLELKRAYKMLFLSGENLSVSLAEARRQFTSPGVKLLLDFIAASKRGVCRHRSLAYGEGESEEAGID
jgi:UDP-N-acetylglucosamine acyltransferase